MHTFPHVPSSHLAPDIRNSASCKALWISGCPPNQTCGPGKTFKSYGSALIHLSSWSIMGRGSALTRTIQAPPSIAPTSAIPRTRGDQNSEDPRGTSGRFARQTAHQLNPTSKPCCIAEATAARPPSTGPRYRGARGCFRYPAVHLSALRSEAELDVLPG